MELEQRNRRERLSKVGGRQRDPRIARQFDRVVRLVRLRGVQHLLRRRVLPVGESDGAAVEHGWDLRGRLPDPATRRLAVRPVRRPIRAPRGIDALGRP